MSCNFQVVKLDINYTVCWKTISTDTQPLLLYLWYNNIKDMTTSRKPKAL